MVTVSTKQLFEAIAESDIFQLPEMNAGTAYLYDNIYNHLSKGNDVTLSSLDFDAFESEDIDSLNSLHSDVFDRNCYAATGIMSMLRGTAPIHKAVSYV